MPHQRRACRGWIDILDKVIPTSPEGPIAEFGVFDGYTTTDLAGFGRDVYAFDTFEGLPEREFTPGRDTDRPGKFSPVVPLEDLFPGYPNIIPIRGRFNTSLRGLRRDLRFGFAFIDCDYYKSYRQVLRWLPYHLVDGANIIFEDYDCLPAAKLACDEWMTKWGLSLREKNLTTWRSLV